MRSLVGSSSFTRGSSLIMETLTETDLTATMGTEPYQTLQWKQALKDPELNPVEHHKVWKQWQTESSESVQDPWCLPLLQTSVAIVWWPTGRDNTVIFIYKVHFKTIFLKTFDSERSFESFYQRFIGSASDIPPVNVTALVFPASNIHERAAALCSVRLVLPRRTLFETFTMFLSLSQYSDLDPDEVRGLFSGNTRRYCDSESSTCCIFCLTDSLLRSVEAELQNTQEPSIQEKTTRLYRDVLTEGRHAETR